MKDINDPYYNKKNGSLNKVRTENVIRYERLTFFGSAAVVNHLEEDKKEKLIRFDILFKDVINGQEKICRQTITFKRNKMARALKVMFLAENRRYRISKNEKAKGRLENKKTINILNGLNCRSFALYISLLAAVYENCSLIEIDSAVDIVYNKLFKKYVIKANDFDGFKKQIENGLSGCRAGLVNVRSVRNRENVHAFVVIGTDDGKDFLVFEKENLGWGSFRISPLLAEFNTVYKERDGRRIGEVEYSVLPWDKMHQVFMDEISKLNSENK